MHHATIVRRSRRGRYWGPTLYCESCRKHAPHLHRYEHEGQHLDMCGRCSNHFVKQHREDQIRFIAKRRQAQSSLDTCG